MKWSSLSSGAAVLCAVHCLALPVLAGAASSVHHTHWESPWLEGAMLGTTALIGYCTLSAGYRRHGRVLPLVLLTLGLGLLIGSHNLLSGGAATAATFVGACFAVGAQLTNGRCPGSGCTDHSHCTDVERQVIASRA